MSGAGARIVLAGCAYRNRWARALTTWDVEVPPGGLVHLQAPNGAGKSTWLRAALDQVPARWGRRQLGPDDARSRRRVRYVPAAPVVPADLQLGAAIQLLAAVGGITPNERDGALARWEIDDLVDHEGDHLSEGQRRAALLAIATAGGPAALLLDEPTVALDEQRRSVLADVVAEQRAAGSAVLVVGHESGWWVAQGAQEVGVGGA